MKCSDCRFWKTEECRDNPGEADLNGAENFACFTPKVKRASMSYRAVFGGLLIVAGVLCLLIGLFLFVCVTPMDLSQGLFSIPLFVTGGVLIIIGAIVFPGDRKTGAEMKNKQEHATRHSNEPGDK